MPETLSEPLLVALVGLAGGIALGFAARMGRFCTLGAIEDFLYADSDLRLRMWGFALATAIAGTFVLVAGGWLSLEDTIYIAEPWSPAASIAGGLIFGYGMALAGNCGFGALARFGGGDLRSFVIVLVMGVSAYITLSGPLAAGRVWFMDATSLSTEASHGIAGSLAGFSGLPLPVTGLLIAALVALASLRNSDIRSNLHVPFWGLIVGLAITSGWMGTAWVARLGFDGLPVVSHTFSAPIGETLLYLMTASGGGLSFAVGSVAGVLAGAFLGSLIKGHFRWEACEDPRELKRQIFGAALMGFGAVLAVGCSVGQGLSAFSVLAYSAPLVLGSIFVGAALGLRFLISGTIIFR